MFTLCDQLVKLKICLDDVIGIIGIAKRNVSNLSTTYVATEFSDIVTNDIIEVLETRLKGLTSQIVHCENLERLDKF
jgi:hypothetical protein